MNKRPNDLPVGDGAHAAAGETAVEHFVLREDLRRVSSPIDQFESWRWQLWSFAIFVIGPILVAAVYYGLIVSDRYAVEFRFGVRTASELVAEQDLISTLLGGGGQNDTGRLPYIAAGYLRSRNVVRELDADGALRQIYTRPGVDRFSRFDASASEDALWAYWQSMTTISVDRISGLVLVRVQAFSSADAVAIASRLERAAERMIDDVAAGARKDALALAEEAMERAGARYAAALTGLRDVRNQEGTVDPEETIKQAAATLLSVVANKLKLERERDAAAKAGSVNAPQQRVLNDQIKALDAEILRQTEALTSQKGQAKTAAGAIARFEQQELERRFSERLLEVAQAAYEKAREEAERQHIYLALYVPPKAPEIAEYPRRLRTVAFVGVCAFSLWTLVMLLIAGVRDRKHIE